MLTCEYDDRSSEHLKRRGVGEREPYILDAGGRHVAERGRQEDERVELPRGRAVVQRGVGGGLLGAGGPPPDDPERHHAHHLA